EHRVDLRIALALSAPLLDDVEELRGRARDDRPGLLEVRLLERLAARPRLEQRPPEAKRERARAALERVHAGGPAPERAAAEADAARLLDGRRERLGEARRARVGLLVVVLGGEPHQVLEPELEVEWIALRGVDR